MARANFISLPKESPATLPQNTLSFFLGTGFTLCLFLGIAHYLKTEPIAPSVEIEDLHLVTIPIQPPPPPRIAEPETTPQPFEFSFLGFEAAPSESPVRIAISPPTFDSALTTSQIPPQAVIHIGRLDGSFKPQMNASLDRERVYKPTEVDKPPAILFREMPKVGTSILGEHRSLQVVFMFVVDTNGNVGNIRVLRPSKNPEFDAITKESVKEWTFSPAIKKGKAVKCLVEQPVTVRLELGSPFYP